MRPDPRFKAALNTFSGLQSPRVWSLLVTIFGDLAQEANDNIEGPLLTRLAGNLGIKPEAVRVALHRLRKDDWIQSTKSGRTAYHALTQEGRIQARRASVLIYNDTQDMPQSWQMVLTQNNNSNTRATLRDAQYVQIAPRLFLTAGTESPPAGTLTVTGNAVPNWFQTEVNDTEQTRQFSILLTALERLKHQLDPVQDLTPVEIAVFRCLIVHHWRRLALRRPYLPPIVTGADWPGHTCRTRVFALLKRLQRPSLMDLLAE